jgi:hypothetical protein
MIDHRRGDPVGVAAREDHDTPGPALVGRVWEAWKP